jgi:hypothetical protein
MSIALLGLLLACGWAVAAGHAKLLLVALAAAALAALALARRGAMIGVLVLAGMNGVPFIDTSPTVTSRFTAEDMAVFALLILAAAWILADGSGHRPSRAGRALSRAGVPLLLWWVFTVARTNSGQGVSFTHAASFGRDFAFFAALAIVLPWVRLSSRDIGWLVAVLAAGACVFALGQVMIATGKGQPGNLIHYHYTLPEHAVTRVYANMTDLVTAGVALSLAACLLARQARVRLVALPVALLLTASTVLQLTRARWLGLVLGLVLVSAWFAMNGGPRFGGLMRRRLATALLPLLLAGAILVLAAPGIFSSGTVAHRLTSVFSTLQSGGGTVAVRESVTRTMLRYLGEEWPAGLGFVPPKSHYFQGLPEGSIRDSDVGVLNAVMTMGVVGAALVYLPVLCMLLFALRRSARIGRHAWLRYGTAVWIVATLGSSITLVTLFSASGLVLSAVLLAVLAHPSVLAGERAVSPASEQRVGGRRLAPAQVG